MKKMNKATKKIISWVVILIVICCFLFTPIGAYICDAIAIAAKFIGFLFQWIAGALRWLGGSNK